MIELKNIKKSYTSSGETVVLFDHLDWTIPTGDFIALMWSSGAGKTSLLSLIAGIIKPDTGSISFDGRDITRLSIDETIAFRGKHIAFIFQSFELIPNLTVAENIDIVIDISHARRRFETSDILSKVWLAGKEKRYPHELSGGEQQRVAIARAFVADVPYLLADEPTGNLDETNAGRIMDLITSLHKETKNTILMITHDPTIASYADALYRIQWWLLKQE